MYCISSQSENISKWVSNSIAKSIGYINTDDDDNYEGGFGLEDIEQLVSTIELQFENWVEQYAPIAVDPNDSASVDKFRNCLKKMDSEVVVSLAKTVFQSDNREILQKVRTPCTIIQSSNDVAVPVSVGHYLEKTIKRVSALVFIDMIGHFPQLTAPHKLAEALKGVVEFDPPQI
ncbi:hypothetical protein PIB30_092406 [Stylosanthes scabra]|uniref:Uncharacterized protein n=1 Tax=Stylosanthes scabra TaxID=79078 RepID=A0ABU6YSL8_9FABA|nr:hypothetical protein [Stylosanthes scabra]